MHFNYAQRPLLKKTVQFSICVNLGEHCETITACSVPCEHGRCTNKSDACQCETNWGPPGKCNVYKGPCLRCSSNGGTCEHGPYTCKCKSGLFVL